jgi:hypothetical protein
VPHPSLRRSDRKGIAAGQRLRAEAPVVAREFGDNRYERIEGFDFSAGTRYPVARSSDEFTASANES